MGEIDQMQCKNRSDLLQTYCTVQGTGSICYWEQCWLLSLTAAGRKDLRYLSFTH